MDGDLPVWVIVYSYVKDRIHAIILSPNVQLIQLPGGMLLNRSALLKILFL